MAKKLKPEAIAMVVLDAVAALGRVVDPPSGLLAGHQFPWVDQVKYRLDRPNCSPVDLHFARLRFLAGAGKRDDPLYCHYEKLPPEVRLTDVLVCGIVDALTGGWEKGPVGPYSEVLPYPQLSAPPLPLACPEGLP